MFKFDDMMTVAKFMIAQNDFPNNDNDDNLDMTAGQIQQGGVTSSQGRGTVGVGGGGSGIVSAACFTNCSGHGLCHEVSSASESKKVLRNFVSNSIRKKREMFID